MRTPSNIIQQTLHAGNGEWLLQVHDPPGERCIASIGWTFPTRVAAQSFARCLKAVNPRAQLQLTIQRR